MLDAGLMEIIIWMAFIGLVIFFAYRKFNNASKRKDCCK